jgi:1-pyrroline-5-carboxylate dehydrogenase
MQSYAQMDDWADEARVCVRCAQVLANTVNGTTYAGIRARTTGAPQNHWFGPAGDPRAAGIGTPEAIRLVWSCHREIITDIGPIPSFKASTT